MRKLCIGLLALSLGCRSSPSYRNWGESWNDYTKKFGQFTSEDYVPEPIQSSQKPEVDVPKAKWYLVCGAHEGWKDREVLYLKNLADAMGDKNGVADANDTPMIRAFPLGKRAYFAAQISLPFDTQAWTAFRDDPVETKLTAESTSIRETGLEYAVKTLHWESIQRPEVLQRKGVYLVIGIEKGHVVHRCPTKEHVLDEFDNIAVTDIYFVQNENIRELELTKMKWGISSDDPSVKGDPPRIGGDDDYHYELGRHYAKLHKKK